MNDKAKPAPGDSKPSPRKRVELHKGGVAVFWDTKTHPGVLRFGDLEPGIDYVVAPAEAHRLVTAKRFDYATPEDERRATSALAAAANDTAAPAATTPTSEI